MHADERKGSAVDFLQAAVAHNAALGVRFERLLTDTGSAYRSRLFATTCQALGIKHCFTKPYHPQTNGKDERFIQTCLCEWANDRTWQHSSERTAWLPSFLSYYNTRSPHSAIGHRPSPSGFPPRWEQPIATQQLTRPKRMAPPGETRWTIAW